MSDFFTTAIAIQREIVQAQTAQIAAAQRMLDAGKRAMAAQDATQKAAEANLKALTAWAQLWGWK